MTNPTEKQKTLQERCYERDVINDALDYYRSDVPTNLQHQARIDRDIERVKMWLDQRDQLEAAAQSAANILGCKLALLPIEDDDIKAALTQLAAAGITPGEK